MTDAGPMPMLPARPTDGHKGTFGTALVLGGAANATVMLGAPCLAGRAALRAGAGRVVLAVPAPLAVPAIGLLPEATGLPLPVDRDGTPLAAAWAEALDAAGEPACMVVGPGLAGAGLTGAASAERDALEQVLVRLIARDEPVLVLDAGALTVISETPGGWDELRAPAILTPHPGEFRRIATAVGVPEDPGSSADERVAAAEALARRLGTIVVLKGSGTVVSDGIRTAINNSGGSQLATGGTGDVLAGLIGGLVAAHFRPAPIPAMRRPDDLDLFDLARIAVHVHGRAADAWASAHGGRPLAAGMLAGELADEIPRAMAAVRTPGAS